MAVEYIPKPLDTSKVELEDCLLELTELLAKHAHDLWAKQRMSDGWKWGPVRCDATKTHPCLIPYEDLPESEKLYDRGTALGTIKAVMACGFRIVSSGNGED
jgi:RyR domain